MAPPATHGIRSGCPEAPLWRGRRGGGWGVLVCPGQRHRRFHPPAQLLLRRDRHQAHLWYGFPLWPHRLRVPLWIRLGPWPALPRTAPLCWICSRAGTERDGTSLEFDCGHLLENLSADLTGMKIGIPMDCFGDGLTRRCREPCWSAAQVLWDRGAEVVDCTLPVMQVRGAYLLYHRRGGGQLQPVPVRRRQIRLAGPGLRGPHRPVLQDPHRGLRPGGCSGASCWAPLYSLPATTTLITKKRSR